MQEESLDQIIGVNSIEEFEQKVYSLKKSGMNPREILKINFQLDGIRIKNNISKIKQISEKSEAKIISLNRDSDKAFLFKCFHDGETPIDVVIKYEYAPKYAESVHYEYLEMNNQVQVLFEVHDRLFQAAFKLGDASNDYAICRTLESAVKSTQEFEKYTFPCNICGENMSIGDEQLDSVKQFVCKKWKHMTCCV